MPISTRGAKTVVKAGRVCEIRINDEAWIDTHLRRALEERFLAPLRRMEAGRSAGVCDLRVSKAGQAVADEFSHAAQVEIYVRDAVLRQ